MVMITFLNDTELEIVERYDEETDSIVSEIETFKKGESIEADIFDTKKGLISIQFGDGSCVYNIPKKIVKIKKI